jgi:heme exporter protein D
MHDFLSMGGYAAYVWPSYAVAAAILLANIVGPLQRERRLRAMIRRTERHQRRRRE